MEEWVRQVLNPAQTTIMVVDVQHDFCAPDGRFAQSGMDVSAGRRILKPLASLLGTGRSAGVRPTYLRFVEDPFGHVISAVYDRQRYSAGSELRYCNDEKGQAILPEVAPQPTDPVIDKVRASGFFNTRLDTILRCAGVRTIVLTGVATDSCVLATAIDATARDYYVIVVTDCVASFSEERHEAALRLLSFKHPTVSAAEISRLWVSETVGRRAEAV
jgi:ureidoacrylate peracid hydrolase